MIRKNAAETAVTIPSEYGETFICATDAKAVSASRAFGGSSHGASRGSSAQPRRRMVAREPRVAEAACKRAAATHRDVHRRTSSFSVPSIPGRSSADGMREWQEILQEERALLDQDLLRSNNAYFKMGAVVAVSGLFDLGKLGRKPQAAAEARRYMRSFGIRNIEDVRALGIKGPCLSDLEEIYRVLPA